ncbi:MAG: iron ABC transporter permease [Lachnospiraceae bacterium]|nr:iron ABC transporter permease [Lachnospiraceae bacterium]
MRNWKGYFPMRKSSKKIIFFAAAGLCILAVLGSLCLGAANLSLSQLWEAVRSGPGGGYKSNIFWYVRLPRTIACLLAGAGLSVSGAVIQGVLANQLASPGIIGVNAGAGMAVTICCAFGAVSGWVIAGASFAGALFAVLLVALTARKMNASRTTVILGGVAVSSFLNAVSEAVTMLVPEAGVLSSDFRVGGFSSVSHIRLLPAGILIVLGLTCLFSLCNELDLMNLGEETAQGLGLSVKKMRTVLLGLAALLAGASVSFSGLLGFVGLIVPHIIRRFVGSESRYLLPLCALGGAAFVTLCDVISRIVFMPYEVPVGILLSFIGGPFFIWLLLKKKGGHSHA